MHTHADKKQQNKGQSTANPTPQRHSGSEPAVQFVDKRPGAIAQRKSQKTSNNGPQAMQLQGFQDAAHHSPQTKQTAQLQNLADDYSAKQKPAIQKKENKTGLPDKLKSGIENLSGYSMDGVKVHYNSDKPAQLQAHAYAQGTDIHVASGQEKHLPHEAWHVVQQQQGRVKPTKQLKGKVNINDDDGLEKEADVMGQKALQFVKNKPDAMVQRRPELQGISSTNEGKQKSLPVTPDAEVLQAVFSQTTPGRQTSIHGGVTAGYDIAINSCDLHIAAGANAAGNMMGDFLTALWEARDTIAAGKARNPAVPGGVEMHPGGSQVLKLTMEMIGEAVGQGPDKQNAQAAKDLRQQNNLALGAGIPAGQINDILDSTIVPEHTAYRDSLIGVAGVTMNPIGGGPLEERWICYKAQVPPPSGRFTIPLSQRFIRS
jgi:hypothetical protein